MLPLLQVRKAVFLKVIRYLISASETNIAMTTL
jgi:hypothetical protein